VRKLIFALAILLFSQDAHAIVSKVVDYRKGPANKLLIESEYYNTNDPADVCISVQKELAPDVPNPASCYLQQDNWLYNPDEIAFLTDAQFRNQIIADQRKRAKEIFYGYYISKAANAQQEHATLRAFFVDTLKRRVDKFSGQLLSLQSITPNVEIKADTDGDGRYDKGYTLNIDGTKVVRDIVPSEPI